MENLDLKKEIEEQKWKITEQELLLIGAEKICKKLQTENICDICTGTGIVDGNQKCVCNGTGKMSEAVYYFRSALEEARDDRDYYRNMAEEYAAKHGA